VFDEAGALNNLEAFASRNGAAFYGLSVNTGSVTLEKGDTPVGEIKPILTGNGQEIVAFAHPTKWRVTKS
jgi:dihydroorotase